MNYLAKILLETEQRIIKELLEQRSTGIDICTIVEESRVYLLKVLEEHIRKNTHEDSLTQESKHELKENISPKESTPSSKFRDYEKIKMEELEKEQTTKISIERFPEELPEEIQIPTDKIGTISDFYEETYQNLSTMGKYFIELENNHEAEDTINLLFRSMHTIKGGARLLKIKTKQNDSIRVSTEKLDEVINTASKLSVTRIHFQDQIQSIHRLIRDFKKAMQRIVESIINRLHSELKSEASRSELTILEEMTLLLISASELKNTTLKNLENLELLTMRLQSGVMNFRMVPPSSLFEKFPILVRDIARQIGKKVKLEIYGGDTELDRTIINQLSDPLLHILRNSTDHGIESPLERLQANKKEQGTVQF
jgi:chemotaxis protein histidine kinase CheA